MNIAIVYATNSGNTYTVARVIQEILEAAGHQVASSHAIDADPSILDNKDLILFGSSSWDWESKEEGRLEGHPLLSMKRFLGKIGDKSLENHQFAIFGCGDTDFQHFCGAVDHLSQFVDDHGAVQIIKPLRIDKFYIDINQKIEQVKDWAKELTTKIETN